MRIATSVNRARFVVASLVLLVAGWLTHSPPRESPDPAAPSTLVRQWPVISQSATPPPPGGPYRVLEFSSVRVESLEPPAWFGARDRAPVRIAGKVLG